MSFEDYKYGDRVILVTNGGFVTCKPGDFGTVLSKSERCVLVALEGYPTGLNFYFREVKPAAPVQESVSEGGLFYLIRQRKDDPLKLKVMFANTSSAKMFTSRASADQHQERMTRQHGDKFKFFVTEAV